MKKTMWTAVFLASAVGGVGVNALDNVNVMGSETLDSFVLSTLSSSVCPAAVGLAYQSDFNTLDLDSEQQLVSGAQTVSPMGRFLSTSSCSASDPTRAEGIAFAAQGLSIVASKTHFTACQTAKGPADCSSTPNSGLKHSGTLAGGTYTLGANSNSTHIQGWQDVLRLIYLGLPNTAGRDPGITDDGQTPSHTARDCNSAARQDLANNWGNLFENACEATGGPCTQLNHAFRRDLLSTATDIFRELIGAKLFPFCNQRFAGDTTAADYPTTKSDGSPVFEDAYQDFDPIRRACPGGQTGGGAALPNPTTNPDGTQSQPDYPLAIAEQVCGPKGMLGLVLPITPPPPGAGMSETYPTKPCLKGNLVFGPAPKVPGTSVSTLCINGDVTLGNSSTDYNPATGAISGSSNICLIPAAADGDVRCINGKNSFNAPLDPPFGVIPAAQRDGRVFNLHQYATPGSYRSDSRFGVSRNVVGNFSRIHSTRTLLASGPSCRGSNCCAAPDATSQIGCLVQADPCSIGFAGTAATNNALQTSAATPEAAFGVDVAGIQDASQCIVTAAYPLSRKMYLNTAIGFGNVTGQELALAKCLSSPSSSLLASNEMFPLPNGPVCQDFAQESVCPGGAPANDACANNPSGIPTQH